MNPWLLPELTGDDLTDVSNALTNRYGGASADVFNGLGSEMGLAQPGVPQVTKKRGLPGSQNNAGEFNPLTGNITVDGSLPDDVQKLTLAHELSHAADMYAAPYPLRGSSHLYFDNQRMPYLNQKLRATAQDERENNRSDMLANPWAQVK